LGVSLGTGGAGAGAALSAGDLVITTMLSGGN